MSKLHFRTVSQEQHRLLNEIGALKLGHLVGGTALSLQIGHRKSYDLDYVTSSSIESVVMPTLQSNLKKYQWQQNLLSESQYTAFADNIKVTFFHDSKLLHDPVQQNDLSLASIHDIFSSKLYVMGKRATWRDYVDVATCLDQNYTNLPQGIQEATLRYNVTKRWILEPLAYFDDLEMTPIEWTDRKYEEAEIKDILTKQIEAYLKL